MSNKKKKLSFWKVLLGVILLLATVAVIGKFAGWFDSEPLGTAVETENVQLRTVTQVVTASGTIMPEVEVKLAPDVSGEIIELTVKEGDFVQEGDLLLRIRPDLIEARIDELNAGLLNTKARMEQARASKLNSEVRYQRQKQLYDREMISELDYLSALRTFEADQANFRASTYMVESSKAQLRRAEEELRQTVIRAPMTGTISQLLVERGERVVGSVQMAGTEMLRIARMEQMEVDVKVNENDIVNVTVGDTARVDVDAYPGQVIFGIVTEIANSSVTRGQGSTEQITEYPVKVRILTPHNLQDSDADYIHRIESGEIPRDVVIPQFKPGMTATVDIETHTELNAVSVPIQAVTVRDFRDRTDSDGTQGRVREDFRRVVFLVGDDTAKMVEVETGISDDTHIVIRTGIEEGQQVVTGSFRVLSRVLQDGDRIRTTPAPGSPLASQS